MLPIERRTDIISGGIERLVVNDTWFDKDTPPDLAVALEKERLRDSRRVRLWLGDGLTGNQSGEVLRGWMRRAFRFRMPPVGSAPRYPIIVRTIRSKHGRHFAGNDVVLAEAAGARGWERLWSHPLLGP